MIFSRSGATTRNDIWALPLSGDHKAFPLLHSPFAENHGRLSPDGHWLAYDSFETGHYEVYVRPFPDEGKWQVSVKGGDRPVWSRDGKELFYLAADDTLMAVKVQSGARFEYGTPQPLFRVRVAGNSELDISPDGKRFLMVVPEQNAATLPITVVVNWQAGLKK